MAHNAMYRRNSTRDGRGLSDTSENKENVQANEVKRESRSAKPTDAQDSQFSRGQRRSRGPQSNVNQNEPVTEIPKMKRRFSLKRTKSRSSGGQQSQASRPCAYSVYVSLWIQACNVKFSAAVVKSKGEMSYAMNLDTSRVQSPFVSLKDNCKASWAKTEKINFLTTVVGDVHTGIFQEKFLDVVFRLKQITKVDAHEIEATWGIGRINLSDYISKLPDEIYATHTGVVLELEDLGGNKRKDSFKFSVHTKRGFAGQVFTEADDEDLLGEELPDEDGENGDFRKPGSSKSRTLRRSSSTASVSSILNTEEGAGPPPPQMIVPPPDIPVPVEDKRKSLSRQESINSSNGGDRNRDRDRKSYRMSRSYSTANVPEAIESMKNSHPGSSFHPSSSALPSVSSRSSLPDGNPAYDELLQKFTSLQQEKSATSTALSELKQKYRKFVAAYDNCTAMLQEHKIGIAELTNQNGELMQQYNTLVDEFNQLKDQHDDYEVECKNLYSENDQLKEKARETEQQLAEVDIIRAQLQEFEVQNQQLREACANSAEEKAEIEQLKLTVVQLTARNTALQRQVELTQRINNGGENEASNIAQKVAQAESVIEQLKYENAEISAAKAELVAVKDDLSSKVVEYQNKCTTLTTKAVELTRKNTDLSEEMATVTLKNAELSAVNNRLSQQNAELSTKVKEFQGNFTDISSKNSSMTAKLSDIASKNIELHNKGKEYVAKISELETANTQLIEQVEEITVSHNEMVSKNNELEAQFNELNQRTVDLTSKVEELEDVNSQLITKIGDISKTEGQKNTELNFKLQETANSNADLATKVQELTALNNDLLMKNQDLSQLLVANEEAEKSDKKKNKDKDKDKSKKKNVPMATTSSESQIGAKPTKPNGVGFKPVSGTGKASVTFNETTAVTNISRAAYSASATSTGATLSFTSWPDIFLHLNDKLLWKNQPELSFTEKHSMEHLCTPVLQLLISEPSVLAEKLRNNATSLVKDKRALEQQLEDEKNEKIKMEESFKQKVKELQDKLEKLSVEDWTADLTALTIQLQEALTQSSKLEDENKNLSTRLQTLEKVMEGHSQGQLMDEICKVTAQLNQVTKEKSVATTKMQSLQTKITGLEQAAFKDLGSLLQRTTQFSVNGIVLDILTTLIIEQRSSRPTDSNQ